MTTPPTEQQLDEITARANAATPGPWKRKAELASHIVYVDNAPPDDGTFSVLWNAEWATEADAEFTAHAPEDVRSLLAEIDRLKGQRKFLLGQLARKDAASGAADAALAAFLGSEVPTEPETATEAPEGPPRDSGTLEPEVPLPDRLEAVLTQRFTELGNPYSRMRIAFQGPDGWPASKEVGPHDVAEVLRELLAATTEETAR